MKTCWQILEIESTTQIDIIRQAYLARLPLCHPETDPQGFKALRQAYEEALRLAVNPVEEADDEEKDAARWNGECTHHMLITKDMFYIAYPHDGHKAVSHVDEKNTFIKIILKLPV